MIQAFSQTTVENLGFYVYALMDPSTDKIFYIGKGLGDRVFAHENEEGEKEKNLIIERLKKAGLEVGKLIVRHGLTEAEAFQVEGALIDTLPRCGNRLANIQGGRHGLEHGLKSAEEIEAFYAVEEIRKEDFRHQAAIININRSYKKIPDVYEATRGNWVISPKVADRLAIAIAEYRGVFRAVFAIEGWAATEELSKRGKPRLRFTGADVSREPEYALYMNKRNGFKRPGQANPVQFVFPH